MENSSREFQFVLHGLNDTMTNRNIYFAFGLLVYILTLFVNLTLVITVILDKTLHEPMYLFICSLFVNGICGASAFYPKILVDLLSESHVISFSACLIQIYLIFCYALCELTCLTVMAYDRYVAICKPLEYFTIMTHQKVMKLLAFSWLFSLLQTSVGVVITAGMPLCGNDIDKLYCSNWEVVKLSCTDVIIMDVYGNFLILSNVFQVTFILVSYIHIIRASLQSRMGKVKFMQTCLPHLITLTNFTLSLLFDIMFSRYNKSQTLQALHNILGIEFLVVPPLLNPIIYGMKLTKLRYQFVKMYRKKFNRGGVPGMSNWVETPGKIQDMLESVVEILFVYAITYQSRSKNIKPDAHSGQSNPEVKAIFQEPIPHFFSFLGAINWDFGTW
ncbi:olfactory receptor 4B13-like [Brachyhypopomus gauderio]|uniref:olfactory receptor 4B13-like n=1 Tax=Brachyhypopomus gauderio TaxID=698409 RepID=UPI0040421259